MQKAATIDPICGMTVSPDGAAGRSEHAGKTYYFCSTGCKQRFDAEPVTAFNATPESGRPGMVQLTRSTPSQPTTSPAPETEDWEAVARNKEYRDFRARFIVAAVLSLPVLLIAMSHGKIAALDFAGVDWVQLVLTTPVVFYSGRPFYEGAWNAFRHRIADMNTLIAVGTGAAYLYSVAATLAPGFFVTSNEHRGMPGMTQNVPVYFEAASVIIALILLGKLFELRATGRTSDAIRRLIGLQPKTAR